MGKRQYLDTFPMLPVSPVELSAALTQDRFMFEGEFITLKQALCRSEACFLQNQEANLAHSIQGSWPTFLADVEPCSKLMPMFANAED